jgi:hypothetical protein
MRWCRLVALLFAAACGVADSLPPGISPGTIVVDLHAGVNGVLTTIWIGGIVAWRSVDATHHTVTWISTPTALDELDVPEGGTSKEVKFTGPGNYTYSCSIHGENGTVHVLPPGS